MNERLDAEWIYFLRKPEEDKPKTQVWHVHAKKDNSWLGDISWFSIWRKYAFRSTALHTGEFGIQLSEVWFEDECLEDIVLFCRQLNEKHRELKKNG